MAISQEIPQTSITNISLKISYLKFHLTHWDWCISNLTIKSSDSALSPGRRQTIIWTNAAMKLIGRLGTNFGEISIDFLTFMHLKVSFAKWQPFCLGLNVLSLPEANELKVISHKEWCHFFISFCLRCLWSTLEFLKVKVTERGHPHIKVQRHVNEEIPTYGDTNYLFYIFFHLRNQHGGIHEKFYTEIWVPICNLRFLC